MANFTYTVRDATGTLHKGVLEADDPNIARARLRQQGYYITSLHPVRDRGASIPWFLGQGVSLGDLMTFTFQLAALTRAGITLNRSLEALHEEIENRMFKKIIAAVCQDIQEGKRFSQALEKHPAAFSPFYVGMVQSGEVSGTLDEALNHLANLLDRDADLRAKWRGMLVYPAIVLSLAAIVITVFLLYVVPAFEKVYRSGGAVLPAPTLVLVALSHVLRRYYLLIIVGLVAGVWVAGQRTIWMRFRPWLDNMAMRLPMLGRVARLVALSRFARTLGTMLKSGVPIIGALEATADAAEWQTMRAATESLQQELSRGRRLREAMSRNGLFPPMLLQVVSVGEESGTLDEMLLRAAELLDRQVDAAVKRLLTLMEPALTLVLGAVVGVILIALYMPIFGLARAVLK